ncbi:MAG TPA: hypothetical protein VIV84_04640, partial [Burkholderiaceae bacterium]
MSFLQTSLIALAGIAPCALLLWLAASVHAQGKTDSTLSPRGVRGMALGLAAGGICWPLQLASANAIGPAAFLWQLVLVALSLGLPALAAHAATSEEHWQSSRRAGVAAAALLVSAIGISAVSGATDSTTALLRTALGATVLA